MRGEVQARRPFGARLAEAMSSRGNLCVGIDPHPALLDSWGLNDDDGGLERFSLTVLEALGDTVAAVKPQVALYERHGSRGMAVLERVLQHAASQDVLTIADAKRGDIGSTMAAYADAWLRDGSALSADALTVSPYLGFGSLRPALDLAARTGRGIFVLALTSNPEGASVQHAGAPGSVALEITTAAGRENAGGSGRLGSVGLVIGATAGPAVEELGLPLEQFGGPILAPGIGAQGAGGRELARTFGRAYGQVLASSSRDILRAGPAPAALRDAAAAVQEDLARWAPAD